MLPLRGKAIFSAGLVCAAPATASAPMSARLKAPLAIAAAVAHSGRAVATE